MVHPILLIHRHIIPQELLDHQVHPHIWPKWGCDTLVIRPNQIGFVEGKNIFDNIFLAQVSLDWAIESDQDLVLLLLNFEKAFDKIKWDFLFPALSKVGFSPKWIKWIFPLLVRFIINQGQWRSGRKLQACKINQVRMPTCSVFFHPCNGCVGSHVGRS